ncbi:GDYXXLXY domain-containing protein [Leptolyngbya sp. AN02str]|uniref:GDYXXLXY domain-containing protein n=1 Tax=Leptolyngbya sp. AN02str TaxID=3423363 RepID=UPI003D319C65
MNPESRAVPLSQPGQPNVAPARQMEPVSAPPRRPLHRRWMFWAALLGQAALILFVPVQSSLVHAQGRTVVLQTMPVDPYDVFRGYYVTLGYNISTPEMLKDVPGWKEVEASLTEDQQQRSLFDGNRDLYVVMEAPTGAETTPPTPWRPIRVSRTLPTGLADNQVAIKGRYQNWQIVYDLERYYMPEEQRDDINNRINELGWAPMPPISDPSQPNAPAAPPSRPFVVEAKVGSQGQSVPVGFWLKDAYFKF